MCPVIVIFAPTACGKTALAREIFGASSLSRFKEKGEVISADSQAVYIGMDKGTAKPTVEEVLDIPHHLINMVTPDKQFGVGEFMTEADSCAHEIWSRGKLPIVLGGTGFYIRNFLLGLTKAPESNPEIREAIKLRAQKEGNKQLYYELKQIDPVYAKKININDVYRICRALEVYEVTGKPLSSFSMPDKLRSEYDFLPVILNRSREELYERIDLRVEEMFKDGLPQEIEKLKSQGYGAECPGMKAIGYSEFFLPGLSIEEIKEKIKHNSHRYAKKQYTFMKDIPGAITIDADDKEQFLCVLNDFVLNKGFSL